VKKYILDRVWRVKGEDKTIMKTKVLGCTQRDFPQEYAVLADNPIDWLVLPTSSLQLDL
ncbi:MAG: hypothetical protein ACI8RD_002922, partial [Bacillariaceae sp.]|jgi:hypothetical protein